MESLNDEEIQQLRDILKGRGVVMYAKVVLLGVSEEHPTGTSALVDGRNLSLIENAVSVFPLPDPSDRGGGRILHPDQLRVDPGRAKREGGGNGNGNGTGAP